jgi:hypothetical protein
MILRFFALANRVNFYTGNLKRFLNDYMKTYAPHDTAAVDEQARIFDGRPIFCPRAPCAGSARPSSTSYVI